MSTTNGHPGLSFGAMNNGLRTGRHGAATQGYAPPSNKSVLPQHPQQHPQHAQHAASFTHYSSHPPQQSSYPQLYSTPNPSPVLNPVQNGARAQQQQQQQQQPQAQLPVPSSRPRPNTHRQMAPQPSNSPMSYLATTISQQHMPQQPMHPQSLAQQAPLSQQPLQPQTMAQQAMGQQSLAQQAISQQPMNQQQLSQQAISQQAINHQQSMSQDKSMLSQTPPSHPNTILTPQPPPQAPVQAQQPTTQPPPTPQQIHNNADTIVQDHEAQQDDTMDAESQGDDGEADDSVLEVKNGENGIPFTPRQPMGPMMSAPPEGGSYSTLDAVHKAVLEYCTSVGYAIVIGRSKKTVPGLKKVLFVCDRAGKPPKRVSPEMRKRKTSSRKCDCQFGFFAIEQRTQWTVRYRPDAKHLTHNHGPSESPMLHPAARKLDSKMVATVKELKESGVGVSQTLEILQAENPNVPLLPRDIYNARAAINRNPAKVNDGLAEDRPAIYSKPRPSAEERIIADLRKELAKVNDELTKAKEEVNKKVAEMEEKLRDKDKQIQKYEMFVDICNERVMFQRERLKGLDEPQAGNST